MTKGTPADPPTSNPSEILREEAAQICDTFAMFAENGAREIKPGADFRKAAEMIRALEGRPSLEPSEQWREVGSTAFGFGTVIERVNPSGAQSQAVQRPAVECHGLDTTARVRFYEHDFYPLSNFSAFRLTWAGIDFDTSEAAYHWEKFPEYPNIREGIRNARSAHDAFKLAEAGKVFRRSDWDAVKVDIMRGIVRAKADQHEYVRRKLLATGDRELVEDSWRDDFWGWGPQCDGRNMLGKLWMEVRAELAETQRSSSGARSDDQETPQEGVMTKGTPADPPIRFKRSGPSPNAPGWVTFNVRTEDADRAEAALATKPAEPASTGNAVMDAFNSMLGHPTESAGKSPEVAGPRCPHCNHSLHLGELQAAEVRRVCGDPMKGLGLTLPETQRSSNATRSDARTFPFALTEEEVAQLAADPWAIIRGVGAVQPPAPEPPYAGLWLKWSARLGWEQTSSDDPQSVHYVRATPPALTDEQIDDIIEQAWASAEHETKIGDEAAETEWTRFGRKCIALALSQEGRMK